MNYEYVDSHIEWIEKYPKHWNVKRLFNVCNFIRGNSTFEKKDLLDQGKYVALQYGKTYKVEEINEQFKFYVNDEFYKSSQVVKSGDTIFVSTSETIEDLGHSVFYNRKGIGLIGGEQILLKPSQNILNGKYLFYSSKVFGEELKKFATGIKVFRFDIYDLKTVYTSIPPLKEQIKIANYLEKACEKIDNTIKIKEQQIEKIVSNKRAVINETTQSGIDDNKKQDLEFEYLPQIKDGWTFDRFKDVARLRDKKTDTKSDTNDYLELEDIEQGTGKLLNVRNTIEVESKTTLFYEGDVLFGKLRPYLEKYYYAEFDGKCTGEILAFEPYKINGQFLKYILGSEWFMKYVNSMSYGAKMPRVNWKTQLAKINLPLPPKDEQRQIVIYLDNITKKTENLKRVLEDQIQILKDYKKSLIFECVTGKKQIYKGDIGV